MIYLDGKARVEINKRRYKKIVNVLSLRKIQFCNSGSLFQVFVCVKMDSTLLNDSSALGTLRDVLLIKTVYVFTLCGI